MVQYISQKISEDGQLETFGLLKIATTFISKGRERLMDVDLIGGGESYWYKI